MDSQVAVGTLVGQLMHERRVAVEVEDDRLVLGEQRVVVGVGQTVGVLGVGFEFHQVDDVDDPDLELRHRIAQDGHGGQRFKRRGIAAAGHDDVRLGVLVGGGPLPDADALGAVLDRLLHRQPLRARMLGSHQHVDISLHHRGRTSSSCGRACPACAPTEHIFCAVEIAGVQPFGGAEIHIITKHPHIWGVIIERQAFRQAMCLPVGQVIRHPNALIHGREQIVPPFEVDPRGAAPSRAI